MPTEGNINNVRQTPNNLAIIDFESLKKNKLRSFSINWFTQSKSFLNLYRNFLFVSHKIRSNARVRSGKQVGNAEK